MAIGCGLKCSKGVLISFNLLFWLSGLVLLVTGIWIILDRSKVHIFELTASSDVSPHVILYLAYLLIVIGCVTVLVGFCGCCGSLYERRSLLITYFAFLFLLLCAEISVAVVTLVYREEFLTGLEHRLLSRFKVQYGQDSSTFTQAVDEAQFRVEEPWQHPKPKDETACQHGSAEEYLQARHKKGCLEDLQRWFKEDTTILIGLGIGIAFFQVFGMIFSISLCRNLGDGGARMR